MIIKRLIAGFFLGIGAILPGVSGGVVAVSLGIYVHMLEAITGFFHNIKQNVRFLLPIALGAGIGILGTSTVLEWLMDTWTAQITSLFIGLVLGSIPTVVEAGNQEKGFRPGYLIATVAAALALAVLLYAEKHTGAGAEAQVNGLRAFMSGGIIAAGMIIPGVSSSFILMAMGIYQPLLSALNGFDMSILIPAALGFVLIALAIVKGVQVLFQHFPGPSYYAVLGLLLTSLAAGLPDFGGGLSWIGCALLFVAGLIIAWLLRRMEIDLTKKA